MLNKSQISVLNNNTLLSILSSVAHNTNTQIYLVGGYVRDLLLNIDSKDIDVLVIGDGIEFAQYVAEYCNSKAIFEEKLYVTEFKNFGTAMLKFNTQEVEFVGARKESYRSNSRKPIVESGSLTDDLSRRDFTVNALAISLNKKSWLTLIDMFDGIKHLEQKVLKTPLEPNLTYTDDPLRMMRAARFACKLNFNIEQESLQAISQNKERISIVSAERIAEELNKIIQYDVPSIGFKILFDTGLLKLIFPQLVLLQVVETIDDKSHKDNFYHTLQVLDNVAKRSKNLWLRWAAILHDIAKPQTKRFDPAHGFTFHGHEDKGARMVPKIFAQFKLPLNEKMLYVQKLVLLHLRPIVLSKEIVTDSAVRRLLFDAGNAIDDLMILCESDITSKNPNKVKRLLYNFEIVREKLKEVEEKDKIRNWQPPITGEIIMNTFKLNPGREIGILKNAIREAILDGLIENNYEQAFDFMIDTALKMGLEKV
jgi:poly(A) polymerase